MYKCVLFYVLYSSVCGQLLEDQRLITYNRCELDKHCTRISNNSFCFNNDAGKIGNCKCVEGYELLSRNKSHFGCLKHADYGEPCEEHIQCQIVLSENAVCDKTCRCADWAHLYTNGKCYTSFLLGDICQSDGNCYLKDGSFANCVAGRCTCKFDRQVPTENRTNCVTAKRLGEECENDNQCSLVDHAVCRVSCKCGIDYTISHNGTTCLKAATHFSDSCDEHEQCSTFLQGSTCNRGKCTCPLGHHGYRSKCVKTARLGESCNMRDECIPNEEFSHIADCIEGTCQCLIGAYDETIGCSGCHIYVNVAILVTGICLLLIL